MDNSRVLKTRLWLKRLITDYYGNQKRLEYSPCHLSKREFGFGSLTKKVTFRHRAFPNEYELLNYLKTEAPAHVNHSLSRYEFPGNEQMSEKVRLGTDLIFDIDVGDLNLKHKHDASWCCEDCFLALKEEITKLYEFLQEDFGFTKEEISLNFSGSRGYHARIGNEKVAELNESGRKEICAYLGTGTIPELIFEEKGSFIGPSYESGSLGKRICAAAIKEVSKSDIGNKENLSEQLKKGNWDAFPKGWGLAKIRKLAAKGGVQIPLDSKVTTDPSHMIRMANTIHGGSLLLAKVIKNLDDFYPLDECSPFGKSETGIEFALNTPGIRFGGEKFGAFKEGDSINLPESFAAYLCAKGRAYKTEQ